MDQETAGAKQAIGNIERNYERYYSEGKLDSVATLYTEEGRELQPNGPAISGREAIRANEVENGSPFNMKLSITSEHLIANGPIAIETGTFAVEGVPRAGAPKEALAFKDNGKYMTHWHQVNGQWLIADLIWNSNQPLPAPPSAPARPARR